MITPRSMVKYSLLLILALITGVFVFRQLFFQSTNVDGAFIREQFTFMRYTDNVWSLVFSPTDNLIASASGNNRVKLWQVIQ